MVEVDNIITIPACAALPIAAPERPRLGADDMARINALRGCVERALVSARCDVDRACALITDTRETTIEVYMAALVALISEFGTRKLTFHPQASPEVSDSEIWLVRALRAAAAHQEAQTRALVAWRVRPAGHRRALFLIGGLADALDTSGLP